MQIKKLISKIVQNPLSKRAEFISIGLCLVIATSIFTYATWGGLIWTSDSFHYWAASRSFIAEGIFLSHDGGSYVYWPPLFPFILSFFTENGYHIFQGVMLNMILVGIYLLFKLFHSSKFAFVITSLFTISVYPYLISSFLWSETGFMLLMINGLYFFKQNETSGKNSFLFLSIICFSLMCLQRNAGMFIMLGISVYSLSQFIQKRELKRFGIRIVAILTSVLPNIWWNIDRINRYENYDIKSLPYFQDISQNLKMIFSHINKSFLPPILPEPLNFTLIVIILITALFLIENKLFIYILIVYFISFSIFPLIDYGMNDRFLTPVIIFFYSTLFELCFILFWKKGALQRKILLLCLVFLFSFNTIRTYKNVKMWHERSITNPKAAKIFF